MTPPDIPLAGLPSAVAPPALRAIRRREPARARGSPRRMLPISAVLHLLLLAVIVLFSHRRIEEAAVSPSFDVLFAPPAAPEGRPETSKPSELPAPATPPAPAPPPAPAALVPPASSLPPPPLPAPVNPPPPSGAMPQAAVPVPAPSPAVPAPLPSGAMPQAAVPVPAPSPAVPAPLPSLPQTAGPPTQTAPVPTSEPPLPAPPLPTPPPEASALPPSATALPSAVPLPRAPVPPSVAAPPPQVRLPPLSDLYPPLPERVPTPPPVPVRPPAPRRPVFPRPMDTTLGTGEAPSPSRQAVRGTGAIDLSLGRAARDSNGTPPRTADAESGDIVVHGAHVGKDWIELLHEWWLQHGYYPPEAARRGEDGTVALHIRVARDGRVQLVELQSSSGSQWLDMGAQATFRGALLPPFPPSTPEPTADLDLTIHYILLRR